MSKHLIAKVKCYKELMTNKLLQARANAGAQVAIWFCFAFDWSREKREFFFLTSHRA